MYPLLIWSQSLLFLFIIHFWSPKLVCKIIQLTMVPTQKQLHIALVLFFHSFCLFVCSFVYFFTCFCSSNYVNYYYKLSSIDTCIKSTAEPIIVVYVGWGLSCWSVNYIHLMVKYWCPGSIRWHVLARVRGRSWSRLIGKIKTGCAGHTHYIYWETA